MEILVYLKESQEGNNPICKVMRTFNRKVLETLMGNLPKTTKEPKHPKTQINSF